MSDRADQVELASILSLPVNASAPAVPSPRAAG